MTTAEAGSIRSPRRWSGRRLRLVVLIVAACCLLLYSSLRRTTDPSLVGNWYDSDYWPQYVLNADGSGDFHQHHWGSSMQWWVEERRLVIRLVRDSWREELIRAIGRLWLCATRQPDPTTMRFEVVARTQDRLQLKDAAGNDVTLERWHVD